MGANLYAQLRQILLDHGCSLVRQGKGSHEIWQSPINGSRFPVSVTISKRPIANAILKQAGITSKL
ncbi:MAG: type II toxin-antitoxin system HicA family toxin [Rhodoferax sp.]|nr:type II toxin-antitoxin system HicA family toxin [Rhodoferax sp.]